MNTKRKIAYKLDTQRHLKYRSCQHNDNNKNHYFIFVSCDKTSIKYSLFYSEFYYEIWNQT